MEIIYALEDGDNPIPRAHPEQVVASFVHEPHVGHDRARGNRFYGFGRQANLSASVSRILRHYAPHRYSMGTVTEVFMRFPETNFRGGDMWLGSANPTQCSR